jgi:putative ABC transport system ATP-binding protein
LPRSSLASAAVARLFEFDGVQVEIDGRRIVDIDELAIADAGITALAGPSGAGKSTLLRLCNRLEAPTAGAVRFRGNDVASLDPLAHRRRVGMVFQRPTTFPGTVRQNLRVACGEYDDDLFAEVLDRAGLDAGFLDRRADDLSGGEAQRMCLARTLATRPEVLLLDEPTSALDPAPSRQLEHQARMLADDGVPLVWVSHDLEQVRRLADDVLVLVAGRRADDAQRRSFFDG